MRMRENLKAIYKVLVNDETLLRLLYYPPEDIETGELINPLDPTLPNILDRKDKWDIIKDRIKNTPTFYGLDDESEICRIYLHPADRHNTYNYALADQVIKIDAFVHHNINDIDMRLSWICDHVNDLIYDRRITGVGKIKFGGGRPIPAPEAFVGYELTYELGSVK